MPIRLKRSTSTNDEFYQLNENSISDGNKVGNGADKEVRGKLTQFSKNILKSTKNLAFNVVDTYAPNVREVKNSFKEAGAAAKEDFDKSFGGMISSAKKLITGSNGEGIKKKLNSEIKDIKNRLKSGKLYTSAEDEMEESMKSQFGDFDFDSSSFGDDFSTGSDSFTTVAEPDSLSQEPFGGVKKGRTRRVNVSSKQRQVRHTSTRMHASKPKVSTSGGGIRAGDELVSGVTQSVGQNVISKQEEVWARTYEANKKNFERLYGYQNTIMKGVNSIVEFNNNVLSKNVQAQLEFQGKMLAAQQDALAHFKEIKDAVLVTSTYKPVERKQTLNSKIANNSVGFDGKAYWENVKRNLGDIAASNPLASLFMSGPGMMDMLSMSEDTGMKMINPLNMLTGGLVNGLVSKVTRNKFRDFNDILSNFGGMFTGRMNMLRDYGKTNISKTVGKLFGTHTTFVKETDNGMNEKDLNAVVGWTGRSDRTLNEVIPSLLAKQLAALTGKDRNGELVYDYKAGQFITSGGANRAYKERKSMVYNDAEASTLMDSMSRELASDKKIADKGYDQNKIKKNIDTMRKNLIRENKPFDPNQLYRDDYYKMLTKGIAEKEVDDSVKMLVQVFNKMSTSQQMKWNNSIGRVALNYQNKLNEAIRYNKVYGGATAVAEQQGTEQLENIKRILDEDPRYALTDEDIASIQKKEANLDVINKLRRRIPLVQQFNTLNDAEGGISQADLDKQDPTGIKYKISSTLESYSVTSFVNNQKRNVGRQSLFEMLNPVGGTSILSQDNKINSFFNGGVDLGMGILKKFGGYGEGGEGIDGTLSYSQLSLDQNEAIINGLKDYKKKLQDWIKNNPNAKKRKAAAEKAIKEIDNKIEKLTKLRKQLKDGSANTTFVNDNTRLGRFFGGLENMYDGFVNDNVIANGTDKHFSKKEAVTFAKNTYTDFKSFAKDTRTKLGKAVKDGKITVKDAGAAIDLYKESIKSGKTPEEAKAEIKELIGDNALADTIISTATKTLNAKDAVKAKATKAKEHISDTYSKSDRNLVETVQTLAMEFADNANTTAEEAWNKAVDSVGKQLNKHPKAKALIDEGKNSFIKGIAATKKVAGKVKGKIDETLSKEENIKLANFVTQAENLIANAGMNAKDAYEYVKNTFKDQLSKAPKVAKYFERFTKSAARKVKAAFGKPLLPSNVDLGGPNFKRAGSKIGGVIGGTLGILGGPLGIAAGAAAGAGIGNLLGRKADKKRFQTIRSPLVAMGYIDAATMKPKELYALANSIRGAKGNAIRALDEFEILKKVAYSNPLGKVGEVAAKFGKTIQRTGRVALMTLRGTLPYKNLVDSLNSVLNNDKNPGEKTSVYTMDKYMLYASINSLSEKTKKERRIKEALMATKDYKKLAGSVEKGESWISSTVKEKITNFKRGINRLRHYKYRFLINFLKGNGYEDAEDMKDPNEIYVALQGYGNKNKRNRKTFEILKRSKAYLNLELAVESKGLDREQRKELKQSLKRGHTIRRKYALIINMLNNNNIPIEKDGDPESIYAALRTLFDKKSKSDPELVNAIKRTKQYKELARAAGEKPEEAKNSYTKKPTLLGKAITGIKNFFNRNKPNYDEATNTLDKKQARKDAWAMRKLQFQHAFGINLDKTNADVVASGKVGEATHVGFKEKAGKAVSGVFATLSKAAKSSSKKLNARLKTDTDEAMQKVGKDTLTRTKNPELALQAMMVTGLANIGKRFDAMSKFLGANDKGEVDERNKETLIGALLRNGGKEKGKKGDEDNKKGSFLGNLLGNYGGSKLKLAGGAIKMLGTAALAAAVVHNVKKSKDVAKEHGAAAGVGHFTGLDGQNQNDQDFFQLERGGKAKDIAKGVALGGYKQMIKGGGSFVKNVAKAATGKGATEAAKKGLIPKVLDLIKTAVVKFISNPKIVKQLPKKALSTLKSLPQKIASKAKSGLTAIKRMPGQAAKQAKESIKSVPAAGWALAIADAVYSFTAGANDAGRYFNIAPSDVTAGMRVTSSIVNGLFSIISSLLSITGVGSVIAIGLDIILPKAWLIENVYKLVASDVEEAELKAKQKDQEDRAKALGTTSQKLSNAENQSLWTKGITGVHAAFSSKTYDQLKKEKIAKDLKMTVEEYERLNGEYQADKDAKFSDKYPEFGKIKSPNDAVKAFKNPEIRAKLEQEAQAMFNSNDIDAIRTVNKRINQKKYGTQNRNKKFLNDSFKTKVENFLKDKNVKQYNLNAIETIRNPFTQFAYYSKGRADDELADYILKLAGFKNGLEYWGGDNRINTKTLGSAHLGGNAIDFSMKNLSNNDLAVIGKTADKYGLEWGGNWTNMYDPPHFQDKTDPTDPTQAFAKGGLVKNLTKINYLEDFGDKVKTRLNPGEMVLNKNQQYALFNKIKKYEQQEVAGTSTKNAVRLNESPLISNAKEDIVLINKVLDIQNKIYQEQTRHNKIAEEFFKVLISLVGGNLNTNKGPRITEQQSSMSEDLMNGAFENASGL